MKKLTLDVEALRVDSFSTAVEMVHDEGGAAEFLPSRRSCIEQCTTSCVP